MVVEIDMENKGKEEVPPKEQDNGKGRGAGLKVTPVKVTPVQSLATDDNVREEPSSGKRRDHGHYHEVIVFNDDGIEVVIRCKRHNTAFIVNA
ncbi:hypothetical protein D1007_53614 [Hordeum vulgare]|nr:hypothetical protein D1007_53614 [Hordeum vulgare]